MEDLTIRLMQEADLPAVIDLVSISYFIDEPLSNYCQLKIPEETDFYVKSLVRQCLTDGISVVAVNEDTGDVIGCDLNIIDRPDFAWKPPIERGNPDHRKISLLENVVDWIREGHDPFDLYNIRKYMDLDILTVKKEYRQRGVAKMLIEESIKLAKNKGISLFLVVALSPHSIKLFRRMEFNEVKELKIKDFKDENGVVTFNDMEENITVMLFAKTI